MTGPVRIDAARLQAYLDSPDGDVARDLQRRIRNVQIKARELAPKRTHELERNVVTRIGVDSRGLVGRVIAGEQLPDARAVWTELGTRAHPIRPKKPGGVLVFTKGGRRIHARSVQHPGTRAQHWLLRALDEARH